MWSSTYWLSIEIVVAGCDLQTQISMINLVLGCHIPKFNYIAIIGRAACILLSLCTLNALPPYLRGPMDIVWILSLCLHICSGCDWLLEVGRSIFLFYFYLSVVASVYESFINLFGFGPFVAPWGAVCAAVGRDGGVVWRQSDWPAVSRHIASGIDEE